MNPGVAAPGAGVTWTATAAHTLLANYSGAPPTTLHPRVPSGTSPEGWVTFEAYVARGQVVCVWGHMDGYTSYAGEKSSKSSLGKSREWELPIFLSTTLSFSRLPCRITPCASQRRRRGTSPAHERGESHSHRQHLALAYYRQRHERRCDSLPRDWALLRALGPVLQTRHACRHHARALHTRAASTRAPAAR
jgi:hypothetical protein